jgi:HK97 family phage major capsid protein
MLSDIAGLQSYLSVRLPKKIALKEDATLLYGEGSNLPSFVGLTEDATAYSDALADSNVNRFDVLTQAVAQVRDDEYMANAIMVHPDDYFNLLLIKDADGMYLMPDQFRFGAEQPRIAGVPLIANTAVTTGDFLVGDFSMGAQLFDRQQSSIRFFEQDQDNAIRNVVTVVASERLALAIYRPTAFVYGDFASALANGSA